MLLSSAPGGAAPYARPTVQRAPDPSCSEHRARVRSRSRSRPRRRHGGFAPLRHPCGPAAACAGWSLVAGPPAPLKPLIIRFAGRGCDLGKALRAPFRQRLMELQEPRPMVLRAIWVALL